MLEAQVATAQKDLEVTQVLQGHQLPVVLVVEMEIHLLAVLEKDHLVVLLVVTILFLDLQVHLVEPDAMEDLVQRVNRVI